MGCCGLGKFVDPSACWSSAQKCRPGRDFVQGFDTKHTVQEHSEICQCIKGTGGVL